MDNKVAGMLGQVVSDMAVHEGEEVVAGTIVCRICNSRFVVNAAGHYIARDDRETGLTSVIKSVEEMMYDAFDCPVCGCQNIVQRRFRKVELVEDNANQGVDNKSEESEE